MILYSYADGDLSFTLGLPVASVRWQLDPATTLAASYAPVRQARLALERQLSPTLKATLEGAIEEESYFIAGRRNEDQFLVLEILRVVLKINKQLGEPMSLGLSLARTFDGKFFQREDFGDEDNKQKVANAWMSGLDIKVSF